MDSLTSLKVFENLVYFAKLGIRIEHTKEAIQNLAWWLQKYLGI